MEDNKSQQNQDFEDVKSTNKIENQQTEQKSAADIIIKKLGERKENVDGNKTLEELKNLERQVKQEAIADQTSDEDIEEEEQEVFKDDQTNEELSQTPNYNDFNREQLVEEFSKLLEESIDKIVKKATLIKDVYYTKRNSEIREARLKFSEEGGEEDKFVFEDSLEENFKDLFEKFKQLKKERNERIEAELKRNAERKHEIIREIESLIEKGETLHKTFDEFYKLRDEWNAIGAVSQNDAKEISEKYDFILHRFYDWVKINKELRDFDLKRNYELKVKLCEEAETLLIEPKIVKSYNRLQKIKEHWRETGPVPTEQKEDIYNRFKEVERIINKNHYEYFQKLRQQQKDNLKAKELLCEEAQKIADGEFKTSKDWNTKQQELDELLKLWKMIGFAPKKYNNSIFEQFINARKKFFDGKREFYKEYFHDLEQNLQLKQDLIIQAENIKDSSDFNFATKQFIDLQKRWKKLGPVPNAIKDEIWQKFNEVCNYFFERKRKFYENKESQESENLKLKRSLLEQIENFQFNDIPEDNLKNIQNFQKQWSEIGFVPIKEKDELYNQYRKIIDEKYSKLNINRDNKQQYDVDDKLQQIIGGDRPDYKLRSEIERVKNKIANFNSDIVKMENNLSFFVKSKSAEGVLKNFKNKIDHLIRLKKENEEYLQKLTKAYRELKSEH